MLVVVPMPTFPVVLSKVISTLGVAVSLYPLMYNLLSRLLYAISKPKLSLTSLNAKIATPSALVSNIRIVGLIP